MKQTAVEWLVEEIKTLLKNGYTFNPNYEEDLIEQAKEMEKQQKDEFAIGFAEWITQAELPLEELLEIYKKEKGL